MTWAGVFLAVFALASVMTILYAIAKEAVVFTSALSTAMWLILSFTPQLTVVSGGEEVLVQIGAIRWIFTGLAILSALVLLMAVIGYYPEEEEQLNNTEAYS